MSLEMKVNFDPGENKWIFSPVGEIDIYSSLKFKEEILENFNSKKTDILIDGANLEYIDSTGLGALIYILKSLKDDGFKIHLINIKANIKKLFDITELDKLFVIRGGEDD